MTSPAGLNHASIPSVVTAENVAEVRVGFLGLGQMGTAHALRLRSQGVPLTVYDRTIAHSAALARAGAKVAPTVSALAGVTDVVFVSVSDAHAVRDVLFGRRGLVRNLRQGRLVVNLTTVAPEEARALAKRVEHENARYLEATVGGNVEAARTGEVVFFLGGETSDYDRVAPVLARMGRPLPLMGPVGAGSSMKLVHDLLTIGNVALLAEGLAFADSLGLDHERVLDVLAHTGARSAMLDTKREALARRQYPAQFRLALARKDLKLMEASAHQLGHSLRITREVRRLADEGIVMDHGDDDFAVIYEVARSRIEGRAPHVPEGPVEVSPVD
jgi:3-hydroxyisobutyrate dehydrogenase-like beta-hydroxyacid dehydrogenase